jgi:histo-blood group ABO system transferase
MKVGLLVIATNKYIKFAQQLYDSAKQHFVAGNELTMFVFTNMPDVPAGTVRIEHEHLAWPGPTLMRYHVFSKNSGLLSKMDYLYYSDVDMRFVDTVGNEVLGDLVGTIHPGFYNKARSEFTYERRPESAAFMGPNDGFMYYAGGFNGGKSDRFLSMAETIKGWIDMDTAKNMVAVWHDESHMNKYMFKNPPSVVLTPSYCYPESWNIPFRRRLLALDKDHHDMRFGK